MNTSLKRTITLFLQQMLPDGSDNHNQIDNFALNRQGRDATVFEGNMMAKYVILSGVCLFLLARTRHLIFLKIPLFISHRLCIVESCNSCRVDNRFVGVPAKNDKIRPKQAHPCSHSKTFNYLAGQMTQSVVENPLERIIQMNYYRYTQMIPYLQG